jgi:integrase
MFFLFALRTGLRAGELVELQWDLDFGITHYVLVQRQFNVRRRRVFTMEQGVRVGAISATAPRVTTPKGKNARKVWLRPEVELALAAHKVAQQTAALAQGRSRSALVFTGPRGARVDVKNLEQRHLEELCRAARVPIIPGLHACRHTYATVLLAAGEDLGWVSQQLGHADTSTTERHYKHWIADHRRDAERGQRIDAAWAVVRGGHAGSGASDPDDD